MAGITTIGQRTSVSTLYDHYFFTRARLLNNELTKLLVAELEALRPSIDAAWAEELGLLAARYDAEAAVETIDLALDGIVDGVLATLLVDLRGDRNSPIYLHYFGTQRPSELKRPVLGGQVDAMRGWPSALAASDSPTLRQHGATLAGLLDQADAAMKASDAASQQLKDFRVVGARAKLVDRFNAVRKSLYGKLGEIQHNNPLLGSGWAESFFRGGNGSQPVTLTEVERRIAAAEVELAALRAERDKLAAEAERVTQARVEAERVEKLASLEAARAAMAELAAQIADLESDLGSAPAPK
jgi:hypothetical protein